jgi:hypothetical protein
MVAEGVVMSGTILNHHDYDVFDLRKDFRHDASLLKFAAVYSRHETVGSGELFILGLSAANQCEKTARRAANPARGDGLQKLTSSMEIRKHTLFPATPRWVKKSGADWTTSEPQLSLPRQNE